MAEGLDLELGSAPEDRAGAIDERIETLETGEARRHRSV